MKDVLGTWLHGRGVLYKFERLQNCGYRFPSRGERWDGTGRTGRVADDQTGAADHMELSGGGHGLIGGGYMCAVEQSCQGGLSYDVRVMFNSR